METSIVAFLPALIAFLVLAIICAVAVAGYLWWKKRRRLARLQKALDWLLDSTPTKEAR